MPRKSKPASSKGASKKKPVTHGGRRPGSGRKPVSREAVTTSSVNLPPSVWALLDDLRGTLTRSEYLLSLILKADLRR